MASTGEMVSAAGTGTGAATAAGIGIGAAKALKAMDRERMVMNAFLNMMRKVSSGRVI